MLPDVHMPTADVYRRFDAIGLGSDDALAADATDAAPAWTSWAALDAERLLPLLVNDLERPAFDLAPPLARLRADAEQRLGRPVRMSGSGSSLFTLFDDEPEARRRRPTAR